MAFKKIQATLALSWILLSGSFAQAQDAGSMGSMGAAPPVGNPANPIGSNPVVGAPTTNPANPINTNPGNQQLGTNPTDALGSGTITNPVNPLNEPVDNTNPPTPLLTQPGTALDPGATGSAGSAVSSLPSASSNFNGSNCAGGSISRMDSSQCSAAGGTIVPNQQAGQMGQGLDTPPGSSNLNGSNSNFGTSGIPTEGTAGDL